MAGQLPLVKGAPMRTERNSATVAGSPIAGVWTGSAVVVAVSLLRLVLLVLLGAAEQSKFCSAGASGR
jgi:hypothetical protein